MPIGFPKTRTGVEIRLLKRFFSPEEAALALHLNYKEQSVSSIAANYKGGGDVKEMLESMAKKGVINVRNRKEGRKYALIPYVIGIYEMQLKNLDPALIKDTGEFFRNGFALEYLTTAVPQMRVIPVDKSIRVENHVASYDEIRDIIEKAGDRISVAECICKKAREESGKKCRVSSTKEVCLGFRDAFDTYFERGWSRKITRDEALSILKQAEKDGLVLQPSNEQEPQFICACCSCCCGILATIKAMRRPADFVASNFFAIVDTEKCNDCGICVGRCPTNAISRNGETEIDLGRCIGCGLCVSSCKTGALRLVAKEKRTIPPKNEEEKFQYIMDHKKSKTGKLITGIKGLMGIPVNQYK